MQDRTVGGRAGRGEEGYQGVDSYDAFRMDFSCQDKLATGLLFFFCKNLHRLAPTQRLLF